MVQELTTQPSMFGRLGKGIAQGLSETVPKEIERSRLASGLKELNQQKNLSPQEYFTGALSVPGLIDRPQVVQSLAELAKQQAQRQAYANRPGQTAKTGQPAITQPGQPISNVDFANLTKKTSAQKAQEQEGIPQGNFPSGQPQIVEKNPLNPELQPNIPWTPEQRDDEIGRVWDNNPWMTRDEVLKQVSDNERRYLESPKAYQEQQNYLKGVQDEANAEIDKQLRKKLHISKDQEIFSKLPGETLNRIERGVSRDLKKNPDANLNDLVNTWTDRALNNEKEKTNLKTLANRSLDEKLFKKPENLEKLKTIGKSFKEFGNSEEFYNTLRSDFGTSPEGAASIAYPLSKNAQSYISNMKKSDISNFNVPYSSGNAVKAANELGDYLTRGDSILSIAKNMKEKDAYFDIKTFLSEVRDIEDELGLTAQQKLEINSRGIGDVFPNWGDIFLFPKGGYGL